MDKQKIYLVYKRSDCYECGKDALISIYKLLDKARNYVENQHNISESKQKLKFFLDKIHTASFNELYTHNFNNEIYLDILGQNHKKYGCIIKEWIGTLSDNEKLLLNNLDKVKEDIHYMVYVNIDDPENYYIQEMEIIE